MSNQFKQFSSSESIQFIQATKTYPGQSEPALDALDLTVEAGELVCLVGPSGGGKTTALQLVNRLVELTSGEILLGDRSISSLDPIQLRRDIGYVIQQTGLFPHLTVGANIGLVPEILGWDKTRVRARVNELLELVGLKPVEQIAKRYPQQLSGGQQQRVGIARALAANPPVMLMDEPFGALDPITREHVQDEFLSLHHEIGKTTLFVTHDIDEAIKMSTKIAVLKPGGLLAQYGTPDEILASPADGFVETFVGIDRGLKRLSLLAVGSLLDGASTKIVGDTAGWPEVTTEVSVRTALSQLLAAQQPGVVVTDGSGMRLGALTLNQLTTMSASTPNGASV